MLKVKVSVSFLKDSLIANMKKHNDKVNEMRRKYKDSMLERLSSVKAEVHEEVNRVFAKLHAKVEAGEELRNGTRTELKLWHDPIPDHADEYASVLSLLEMTEDETVKLTVEEYDQYVNDVWPWSEGFDSYYAEIV